MAMKLIPDSLWMAGCPNAHRSAQYCPALSQVAGDPGTPACLHASPPAFQLYWKICPPKKIFASHIVEQEAEVKCLKGSETTPACLHASPPAFDGDHDDGDHDDGDHDDGDDYCYVRSF